MTVVDAHVHVFKPVSSRYPRDTHEQFPPELEAPVEPLVELMDANGVDHAVLVPLSPHDDYVREVVAQHPGRFAWIGVHDPRSSSPITDLERRGDGTGLRGLRIHHLGEPGARDVRSLRLFPLLEAMERRADIVWFYGAPEQQALLLRVLEVLPGLMVMLNHLGFCPVDAPTDEHGRPRMTSDLPPPTLPVVRQMAAYNGVHVMFSGQYAFSSVPFPHQDLAETARAVYDAYGAARLAWASDYPWIKDVPGYDRQLELVDILLPGIPSGDRAAILGTTAARLFGFPDRV